MASSPVSTFTAVGAEPSLDEPLRLAQGPRVPLFTPAHPGPDHADVSLANVADAAESSPVTRRNLPPLGHGVRLVKLNMVSLRMAKANTGYQLPRISTLGDTPAARDQGRDPGVQDREFFHRYAIYRGGAG